MTLVGRVLGREARSGGRVMETLNSRRLTSGGYLAPVQPQDDATAMRHDAVWACVDLLVDQLAAVMPVDEFERRQGKRVEVEPSQVVASPSAEHSQIDWRTMVWTSLLLRGNAFGLVTDWTKNNYPARVEILNPDAVGWDSEKGKYRLADKSLHDRFPVGDLWHVRGLSVPGYRFGLSPLMAAAAHVELGLAATGFGRRWFVDGGHPSALLSVERDPGPEGAQAIKDKVMAVLSGNREPLVIPRSIEYTPIQVSPEESQFLDTISANAATVARVFRVLPEWIGASVQGGSTAITYSNVEQHTIKLYTYSLQGRATRFEEAWSGLLPPSRVVRHNVDAILRSDALTRTRIMDTELRNGLLGRNEGRALLDREPVPADSDDGFVWPPAGVSLSDDVDEERRLAEIIQKVYLGVDVVLSADEAREILRNAGADLGDEFTEVSE